MAPHKDDQNMVRAHSDALAKLANETEQIKQGQSEVKEGYKELSAEIRGLVAEIRKVLITSAEDRKDLNRLKDNDEVLFEKDRASRRECDARTRRFQDAIDNLQLWKAGLEPRINTVKLDRVYDFILKYEGDVEAVQGLRDFVQGERGWRRFIPAALAALAVVAALTTCTFNAYNFVGTLPQRVTQEDNNGRASR